MKPILVKNGEPLSKLFIAINHYISTGDHFGEGTAMENGKDEVLIFILVNINLKDDREDFEKFKSKFDQISKSFDTRLIDRGSNRGFHTYVFSLRKESIQDMAVELLRNPGPLGWGSMKALIDKHLPA